jgi:hypothetical protein
VNFNVNLIDIFDSLTKSSTPTNQSFFVNTKAMRLGFEHLGLLNPELDEVVEFPATLFDELDTSVMSYITKFAHLELTIRNQTSYVSVLVNWLTSNLSCYEEWHDYNGGRVYVSFDQELNEVTIFVEQSNGFYYIIDVSEDDQGRDAFTITQYLPGLSIFDGTYDFYYAFSYVENSLYEYIQYVPDFIDQSVLYSAQYRDDHWEMLSFHYSNIEYYIILDNLIFELRPLWTSGVTVQSYAYSNTALLAYYIDYVVGNKYTEVALSLDQFSGWTKLVIDQNNILGEMTPVEYRGATAYSWSTFGNGALMNTVDLYTESGVISTGSIHEGKVFFAGANANTFYSLVQTEYALTQANAIAYFWISGNQLTETATSAEFVNYVNLLGLTSVGFDLEILLNSLIDYASNIEDNVQAFSDLAYGMQLSNKEQMQAIFMMKMRTCVIFDDVTEINE